MGEAKRRKKLDPNYGKSSQFKMSQIYYECKKQYGNGGLVYEPKSKTLTFIPEQFASRFDNLLENALNVAEVKENSYVITTINLKTRKHNWIICANEDDEANFSIASKFDSLEQLVENLGVFPDKK